MGIESFTLENLPAGQEQPETNLDSIRAKRQDLQREFPPLSKEDLKQLNGEILERYVQAYQDIVFLYGQELELIDPTNTDSQTLDQFPYDLVEAGKNWSKASVAKEEIERENIDG